MKKLLLWLLTISMVMSVAVFPATGFAEETSTGTETETPVTDIVHFAYDFEDYTAADVNFPKTGTLTLGKWNPTISNAGKAVNGWDGNAFKFTCAESAYTYRPTTKITSGKYLVSFDFMYDTAGSADAAQYVLLGDSTIYLMNLENPSGSYQSSIRGANTSWRCTHMFYAEPGTVYTVENLIDMDTHTIYQYVNGALMHTYANEVLTGITQFKFYSSQNIAALDNFKLIENPTKYNFSQTGAVVAGDNILTVEFSDAVAAKATDFVIDDGTGTAVTAVEAISGKKLKLTLSQPLTAGAHTVSLASDALLSGIGTTPETTTASFTVVDSKTCFDIDFEKESGFGLQDYITTGYSANGTWTFDGGAEVYQTKANGFGDNSTGVYATDAQGATNVRRNLGYTLNTPVTSGKITVSFDAAFDSTICTERMQMLYINNDANNGNLMVYGTGTGDSTNTKVIAGAKADMHYSGGNTFAYNDNQAYRWDTVIDLDNKTVTNYCDGVAYQTVSLAEATATALTSVSAVTLRLTPSVVFFDNYRISYNVGSFGMSATDISSSSKETYVYFGDTLAEDAVLTFIDPNGSVATLLTLTAISPRIYCAVFEEPIAGIYTVKAAPAMTSALGTTLTNSTTTFVAAERPTIPTEYVEYDMIRQHPRTFDFEGAVASPNTYTDTDGVTKVPYNNTTWKVSGGPDGGHVYALTTDAVAAQNGSTSVELRSTDNSTMCAFYANRFWMGKQGDEVSGSLWVYWPSTTTSQYLYVEIANYTSSQQSIVAKSAKYNAGDIPYDQWVEIPINPVEGTQLTAALQIKIRFKGIAPIYIDNISVGTVESYPNGYYVLDAIHTEEAGVVTATATAKKRNYWKSEPVTVLGAAYDKEDMLVGVKSFIVTADADETPLSFTANTDNLKVVKWFVVESTGSLRPVAESKKDYKTSFKILCHNVGKYSQGTGAGVPNATIDEATGVYLDFLADVNADVFCVQEHAHYFDDAETVTATEQVFGKYYDYNFKSSETKTYVYQGQAIYSKLPIKDTGMGDLPYLPEDESQRGYTKAVIEIDGKEVAFFNTHLSLNGLDYRGPSRDILIEEMNKYEYAVLCMDANSGYTEWQQFLDAGYVLGNGNDGKFITTTVKGDTTRNTEDRQFAGSNCIDQIIVSPTLEMKYFETIFDAVYSDHYPIVAEIAFK